jgi:mannose-6-phosphate isomerase-like protein (cupin superfamily)
MKGYHGDIEQLTTGNDDFRRVLYTGENLQLVLMTLRPGEEIGAEVHDDRDQFFRFEEGTGDVHIDSTVHAVADGSGVIVPASARHNVRNTGNVALKFYTIYGPPEHLDHITHVTKAEAQSRHADEEWDGGTTE